MLEEICLNHVLGWSKRKKEEIQRKEHEYCPGCIYDEYNKQCPHYKPIKLYVLEILKAKKV